MATYHISLTVPVLQDDVPSKIASIDDVTHLCVENQCLSGYSRRNWFEYMIKNTIEAYDLKNLSYFTEDVVVLGRNQIFEAVNEIKSLLLSFEDEPGKIISLSGQDAFSAREIQDAIKSSEIFLNPAINSDDGDDIIYLISFIKAHLLILESAWQNGLNVIYAQSR